MDEFVGSTTPFSTSTDYPTTTYYETTTYYPTTTYYAPTGSSTTFYATTEAVSTPKHIEPQSVSNKTCNKGSCFTCQGHVRNIVTLCKEQMMVCRE